MSAVVSDGLDDWGTGILRVILSALAEDGLKAVEVALSRLPDLIRIDLQLPKLNGLDVTRKLRRHPTLRNIPIIVVSGHDPAKHRQSALDAGCSDYLLKPIDFVRLDAILRDNVPVNA